MPSHCFSTSTARRDSGSRATARSRSMAVPGVARARRDARGLCAAILQTTAAPSLPQPDESGTDHDRFEPGLQPVPMLISPEQFRETEKEVVQQIGVGGGAEQAARQPRETRGVAAVQDADRIRGRVARPFDQRRVDRGVGVGDRTARWRHGSPGECLERWGMLRATAEPLRAPGSGRASRRFDPNSPSRWPRSSCRDDGPRHRTGPR